MRKVDMTTFLAEPDRYALRPGDTPGAPSCPYGNQYQWVGYDREMQEFVRFTKSVFKRLITDVEEPSFREDQS
jgi:hypothetical protein